MGLAIDQFEISSHNIYMNNYYRHLDEFIRMLKDFRASRMLYGSQGDDHDSDFYRLLYITLFGKNFRSNNEILAEKIEIIQNIINEVLLLWPNEERQGSEVIARGLRELGFQDKVQGEHVHVGGEAMEGSVQDSLHILLKILSFSNQDVEINRIQEIQRILE
jgi:hypothetical protein